MAPRSIKYRLPPLAGHAPADEPANDGADSRQDRILGAAESIVSRLTLLAEEQQRLRYVVEIRWLDNLRRYHGRYDEITEKNLRDAKGRKSRLFANITRPKTVAWEARLSDLLFPTDDRNWAIEPTPVPQMNDAAMQLAAEAKQIAEQATEALQAGNQPGVSGLLARGKEIEGQQKALQAVLDEAKRRADLMQDEIDDQLEECRYNWECRQVIHDCCKLGIGVLKGPLAANQRRRSWQRTQEGVYQMDRVPDQRPKFSRVDPWHFFPDMAAKRIEDTRFAFELHLWTDKQFREEGGKLDFDAKAAAEILSGGARDMVPYFVTQLRMIVSGMQPISEERYFVWEYRGPLDREELISIATALGTDPKEIAALLDENPFRQAEAVVWFCNGRLLKFGMNPLDSGESLYSVFPFEPDDASIFALGVPDLLADSQAALCAAWRMQLDNAALSSGPQTVIDKDAIKPADGMWDLRAHKVWLATTSSLSKMPEGMQPFRTFDIPSRQDHLQAIIAMADQFADTETFMPKVAEGDQGSQIQTAQGLSLLMNSANVVFRRIVKAFDDQVTVPAIRRIYDFNMQFSKREDIKGDFEVKARGSSVLLTRELQLQNLNNILSQYSAHPVIGPMLKTRNAFVKYVQAAHLTEDEMVKSEDVIKRETEAAQQAAMAAGAGASKGKSPEEMQHEKEMRAMDNEAKVQIATLNRDTAMMKLAQESNMTLQQIGADLKKQSNDISAKERMTAAQIAAGAQPKDIGGTEFGD